ncbi:Fatty acid oxidation complex subunit alpha [Rhodanobacter lindaniclasticus]
MAADDDTTRIGLPEVMLGIHPGWGGTARLPRLIGATEAMPVMLTGRPLSARRALALGVVDHLVRPQELLAEARLLLRRAPSRPFMRRAKVWASNSWLGRQILAPIIVKQTAAKVRREHYPAPFALIDVWKRGGSDIQQRLKIEADSVARLAQTPTARNLIRIFFLQERLKGQGGGVDAGIGRVHVVGAGVMGGDIAAWLALKGMDVSLQDREMKYVQPALDRARALYEKKFKTPEKIEAAAQRLRADIDGKGVAQADLAIEAIYENAEAKEALYATLEPQLKDGSILASNTSSIPLDELRGKLAQPARFVGLHFFNPVAQMPLVEVVRQDRLDPAIEKRALAFCKAIGKLPVAVKGTPGFLVNRILVPYLLEAMRLYSEGVPGAVLDREAKKFGMPMGPIELADTVGLDVCASVGRELAPFLGLELPPGIDEHLAAGKRGKKDGQGLVRVAGRQAAEAGSGQRLRDAAGSAGSDDPVHGQRGGGLPDRWRGRRCRPAGCRRDLRHRFRAFPRRPDPVRAQRRRGHAEGQAGATGPPLRRSLQAQARLGPSCVDAGGRSLRSRRAVPALPRDYHIRSSGTPSSSVPAVPGATSKATWLASTSRSCSAVSRLTSR